MLMIDFSDVLSWISLLYFLLYREILVNNKLYMKNDTVVFNKLTKPKWKISD